MIYTPTPVIEPGTAVYVTAPIDPTMLLLQAVAIWSLTAALAIGLVGWRRSVGASLATRLWVAALTGWAAVPGLLLMLAGQGYGSTNPFPVALLVLVLAACVTIVAAATGLTESVVGRRARRATGRPSLRRRVHWLWAGLAGLALGTTGLVVAGPWATSGGAGDQTRTLLLWLVALPTAAAALQAWRRGVRDQQLQALHAGAGVPDATLSVCGDVVDVLRRHLAVVRRAPDRPVAPGKESATLARTVAISVAALLVTGALLLQAVAVSTNDAVGLTILAVVVLASTATLAVAAAPQVLDGVRTARRRQLVERDADPPAPEPT